MKLLRLPAGPVTAVFLIMALTGCTTNLDAQHRQHHPDSATSQAPGTMDGGTASEQRSTMDMKAMCDMHQKMMSAKTPEERKAMMDGHMKNMTPEMMQKHMEMMQSNCK